MTTSLELHGLMSFDQTGDKYSLIATPQSTAAVNAGGFVCLADSSSKGTAHLKVYVDGALTQTINKKFDELAINGGVMIAARPIGTAVAYDFTISGKISRTAMGGGSVYDTYSFGYVQGNGSLSWFNSEVVVDSTWAN